MPEAKLYLPKTADRYGDALDHVKRQFAEECGGYTTHGENSDLVIGGWMDSTGQLIEEPVTVVETVHGATIRGMVYALASDVLEMTHEDAVMVVADGEKIIVD